MTKDSAGRFHRWPSWNCVTDYFPCFSAASRCSSTGRDGTARLADMCEGGEDGMQVKVWLWMSSDQPAHFRRSNVGSWLPILQSTYIIARPLCIYC